MKKLTLILSFLISVVFCFGQNYPTPFTKIGSPGTMVFAAGGLKSDSTFIPPVYTDTTVASRTRAKLYVGSVVYTSNDNGYWIRDAVKWNRVNNYCQGVAYGGIVIYSGTGLVFNVSPGQFCLNNRPYNFSQGTVTLAAADPSLPRQDVIFADTAGNVGRITGTPNANPAVPQVNSSSQIYLTSILVPAGSTTPGGVTSLIVYDENTEWATSATGGVTVNFNNTISPYHLVKAIDGQNNSSSATLHFNNGGGVLQSSNYMTLSLFINNQEVSLSPKFQVALTLNGNPVTQALQITSQYGYNSNTSGNYQNVSVPIADFQFYNTRAFDGMTFYLNQMPDFYLDYIRLQSGVSAPVVSTITLQQAFNNDSTRYPVQIDSRTNSFIISSRQSSDKSLMGLVGASAFLGTSDTTLGYASTFQTNPFFAEMLAKNNVPYQHKIDVYADRIELEADSIGVPKHVHIITTGIDTTSSTAYIAGYKNGTDELIKVPFSGGSGGSGGSLQDAYDTSIARGNVPNQITGDVGFAGNFLVNDPLGPNQLTSTPVGFQAASTISGGKNAIFILQDAPAGEGPAISNILMYNNDNTLKVAINNADPQGQLDVQGPSNTRLLVDGDNKVVYGSTNGGDEQFYLDGTNHLFRVYTNDNQVYTQSSDGFVFQNGNVGIGTATPSANLDVEGKAVIGNGNSATGDYSAALGGFTTSGGNYSASFGQSTNSTGESSAAFGNLSTASGNSAFSSGYQTVASGDYSSTFGNAVLAKALNGFTLGDANNTDDSPDPTHRASDDRIFQIGIGSNTNAMTVLRNGNIGIGSGALIPTEKLTVDGNAQVTGFIKTGATIFPYTKQTGDYTVDPVNDRTISVDNGASGVTITLPDATANPHLIIVVKRYDATSIGTVTIASAGGDVQDETTGTFSSTTTLQLWGNQGQSVTMQANDAGQWEAIN